MATGPGAGAGLLALGLSHRTAPVALRERAALSEAGVRALARALGAAGDVAEAVVLSTCNRTEIYACAGERGRAERALAAALVAHTRIRAGELACARYMLHEEGAVTQLLRVAAGLDSMVLGESEIQGQVRRAWEIAAEEGTVGPVLHELFRRAVETGKRVRSLTRIGAGSCSVAAAAVDLVARALPDLGGRRAMVLGAGRMAEAAALALTRGGVAEVVVASRRLGAARELGARLGGRGVGLEAVPSEIAHADVVVAATGAPHPILGPARVAGAAAGRPERPLVIVDLSVPRDVEEAVGAMPGVRLFDIDDLERVVEASLNGRRREARRAEAHVREAAGRFAAWRRGREAAPAIASLRARAERIRRDELARALEGWTGISEGEVARLEALTAGIVGKLLHEPTVRARASAEAGDGQGHVQSLRHLFALADEGGPAEGGSPAAVRLSRR